MSRYPSTPDAADIEVNGSKSKKHYVDLRADGDKRGGFAIQCDEDDDRGLLAGLEGVAGKKAVNSDAMTVRIRSRLSIRI